MFQFIKISVNQLLVFSQILNQTSLSGIEFIENRFTKDALNFPETVEFLEELGLITVREREIIVKNKYRTLLNGLGESQQPQRTIKSFFSNQLLSSEASFTEYVSEFLIQFKLKNDSYEFLPSSSQRLEYSGLRNFLIDLGVIYVDSSDMRYFVTDNYFPIFINLRETKQLSPDELFNIQQKRGEVGRAAELRVIEYEKQRLSKFPHLVKMIEHVAIKDVMAGYDIRSYDEDYSEDDNLCIRLIEVKAVSPWDFRFYWSRNEIDKAMTYQQDYYLYLLPVIGKNEFDIKKLKIINDPYSHVYENEGEWIRTDELVAFSIYKD